MTYNDPLDHIFTEFDEDGDGHLTSVEIANALKSRGVEASPDQVQEFIDGTSLADEDSLGFAVDLGGVQATASGGLGQQLGLVLLVM